MDKWIRRWAPLPETFWQNPTAGTVGDNTKAEEHSNKSMDILGVFVSTPDHVVSFGRSRQGPGAGNNDDKSENANTRKQEILGCTEKSREVS
jgi:hypothetical protein